MREGLLDEVKLTADRTFGYSFRTMVQPLVPNVSWYLNDSTPVSDLIQAQSIDGTSLDLDSRFIGLTALGGQWRVLHRWYNTVARQRFLLGPIAKFMLI